MWNVFVVSVMFANVKSFRAEETYANVILDFHERSFDSSRSPFFADEWISGVHELFECGFE